MRSSYGSEPERDDLVVLDADLASDCRVRAFELAYPDRFVECGIAEQDMVSTAAGLARHGLLPVVNSFASFLASRANEQIYNQASERAKVKVTIMFRGREREHPDRGRDLLMRLAEDVKEIGLIESQPLLEGRNMTMVLGPTKNAGVKRDAET